MPSKNEIALLTQDITEEVNRDAEVISGQLFGGNAQTREPDLARMTAEQLQEVYTRKYLENDRDWLQKEARRDPQQFIKVANQIGVVLPDQIPGWAQSPATLPQPQPQPPPVALPQAVQPPQLPMAPTPPPAAVMPLAAALVQPQVPPVVPAAPQPILVPPEF